MYIIAPSRDAERQEGRMGHSHHGKQKYRQSNEKKTSQDKRTPINPRDPQSTPNKSRALFPWCLHSVYEPLISSGFTLWLDGEAPSQPPDKGHWTPRYLLIQYYWNSGLKTDHSCVEGHIWGWRMAQWLSALAAPAEDLGSIPNIHIWLTVCKLQLHRIQWPP